MEGGGYDEANDFWFDESYAMIFIILIKMFLKFYVLEPTKFPLSITHCNAIANSF